MIATKGLPDIAEEDASQFIDAPTAVPSQEPEYEPERPSLGGETVDRAAKSNRLEAYTPPAAEPAKRTPNLVSKIVGLVVGVVLFLVLSTRMKTTLEKFNSENPLVIAGVFALCTALAAEYLTDLYY